MTTLLEKTHRHTVRQDIATIAQALQETLGQKLTAYAISIKDPKAIGRYARQTQGIRDETERRLRDLYQIVTLLLEEEVPTTVRAWMIGMNPQLDETAPVDLLHEGKQAAVLNAAEAFRAGG